MGLDYSKMLVGASPKDPPKTVVSPRGLETRAAAPRDAPHRMHAQHAEAAHPARSLPPVPCKPLAGAAAV